MRHTLTAMTLAGALLAPAATFAQSARPASSSRPAAVHSVEGTVKSVDASSVVITRAGRKGGEMSFKLDPGTQKDGSIASGSKVSVRYHMDGSNMVASAIHAEAPKAPRTAKK